MPPAAIEMAEVSVWRSSSERGPVALLRDVSWTVGEGEHWAVLGPNGAGKTTLLNLAGAVDRPTSGTVRVLGGQIGGVDMRDLRERIGLVDARIARSLRGEMPAARIVLTGAFGSIALQRRRLTDAHVQRASDLLALVGASALAERRFELCSQGERQRVLLARALMADPELLLLDEPASGLDLPSREQLVQAMVVSAAQRPELPSVTVTHHLEEIPPSCTHALLLRDGRVLVQGPIGEVLSDESVSACFGVDVDVHRRDGRWAAAVVI